MLEARSFRVSKIQTIVRTLFHAYLAFHRWARLQRPATPMATNIYYAQEENSARHGPHPRPRQMDEQSTGQTKSENAILRISSKCSPVSWLLTDTKFELFTAVQQLISIHLDNSLYCFKFCTFCAGKAQRNIGVFSPITGFGSYHVALSFAFLWD